MSYKSTHFDFTVLRGHMEYTLEVYAQSTGYNNRDVGGGGSDELDYWEIQDDQGIGLTKEEEQLLDEAAQEALYDT